MTGTNKIYNYRKITEAEQADFARRLRTFRRKNNLTQKQMALAMGIGHFTLVKLENCYERPYGRTLAALRRLEEKCSKAERLEMASLIGLA